ncbi:Cytoplasmic thioredoxin isoenzyme 2 [Entomortierella lignicola]|nr:Cytoplasmic thioredoxin isoenzyme 2 [Entomortierella lignicola]
MVKAITSTEEFKDLINSGKKVIVDYHAVWCGPCKMISPAFETFSKDFTDIEFVKVDVDELSQVSQDAGITAMPTFQAYYNGNIFKEIKGANPANLKKLIEDLASA